MERQNIIREISSGSVPLPVGAYSQAIKAGDFLFCSGQVGLCPETRDLISGGVEKETERALENITEILKAAKSSLEDVTQVDVFLGKIEDFEKVNKVYRKYFKHNPKPARQVVAVAGLPKGAGVKISCVAYVKK